ncbi:hypothetical protein BC835DRAFT_513808 [Cytidiella melzeri]|nr:hypothetical protein BC835DRAFT_513808 [Cytidiella melzeri]
MSPGIPLIAFTLSLETSRICATALWMTLMRTMQAYKYMKHNALPPKGSWSCLQLKDSIITDDDAEKNNSYQKGNPQQRKMFWVETATDRNVRQSGTSGTRGRKDRDGARATTG